MSNGTTVAWMLGEYPTTFWFALRYIPPIPGTVNMAKNLCLGPRRECDAIIVLNEQHRI